MRGSWFFAQARISDTASFKAIYPPGTLRLMAEIPATIRLRPTRIGFLVRPTDLVSIRRIMRNCTCLWGGVFNPIIPVFRVPPKEWKVEPFEFVKGLGVAKGYIDFFEPDVFVESEDGLLEEAGLGALREKRSLDPQALTLKKFLAPQDHRDWSEPAFGLNIMEVFRYLYDTELRFQPRDKRPSVIVKPERSSGLVEAVFGAFPRQRDTAYIAKGYRDVFTPNELEPSPETWLEVFKKGAETPLRVTRHGIDIQRYWYHDVHVYVFDATRSTDLIDLWNMRLEPYPVLPVPIEWFESIADHIREILKAEYRPIIGNPHGVMHQGTVEFGRSIGKTKVDELIKVLKGDLPPSAFIVKHWRNRIWAPRTDDNIHRDPRLEVTADEKRTSLEIKEGRELNAKFEALAPKCASRFGGHYDRWVNAVRVSQFSTEKFASVLPFNIFDRRWPCLGMPSDRVIVGSEGWIFGQRYKNWSPLLTLLTMEDAIIGSLERLGIQAKLSDPGHVAKQMLDHLGGLWDAHLLADLETLQLLNRMAGGVRRSTSGTEMIEETFERRSAPVKTWIDLVARRKKRQADTKLELAEFTKRNLIRLGLQTVCPLCHVTNWHSLTAVDYGVTCERCLKRYDFPQAGLGENNRNWHYRVMGPFSVPDYGRGSYSVLLTLRVIKSFRSYTDEMTFSTAMELKFDGIDAEVDFVAWHRGERHDADNPPDLLIGEAKSIGQGDLIKSKDLAKLHAIARKLPGAMLVISVLRENFTASEKNLLKQFVKWCRRLDDHGCPTNPVILLTAHELFFDYQISATWNELGQPYKSFADYDHTRNLHNFADATQRIYLGLPSFHDWRAAEWKKRRAKHKQVSRTAG